MANPLPPPPLKSPDGSYAWLDWYRKLQQYVSQGGSVPWNVIDFTGSKLSDILNKPHNILDSIQGGTTGEFYHLTAAEHSNVAIAVPNTRTLTAGTGLTGGGDLSADRTFNVGANADGSITVNANDIQVGVLATDVQHGNRGGGALHSNATTSTAGFMSAADKTTFDGMGTYQTASASGISLTSGVSANVTSVSLTAGDWDVSGTVQFSPAGTTTIQGIQAGISTTSSTLPAAPEVSFLFANFLTGSGQGLNSPVTRVNLGSTTTVYLVTQATFGVSTMTAAGIIRARRARV